MTQPYIPSSASVNPQENLKCTPQELLGWQRSTDLEPVRGSTSPLTYSQMLLHLLPALPPWTCNLTPGPQLFQMKHGDQKI